MKKRWILFLAALLFALVLASQASASLLTAKITSVTKSCKTGESIDVTYSRGGLEGDVYIYLRFYAVPGYGKTEPCVLLHEEKITPGSSGEYSLPVDASAGEWVMTQMTYFEWTDCLGSGDRFYTQITDGTARTEFSACSLGKSGWVDKNGKRYYGDGNGNAVFGWKEIDGKRYFFNGLGELVYGWFRYDDLYWCYADENGVISTFADAKEIVIPDYVDRLSPSYFVMTGTNRPRDQVIYCSPGSYAEQFAIEYGLQYDNGEKRVVGYDIEDEKEKLKWIIDNYIKDKKTEKEKIYAYWNWLVSNVRYDLSEVCADGIFLRGCGKCSAYANAFVDFAQATGIEAIYVSGDVTWSSDRHAWNMVRADGQWYFLDSTGTTSYTSRKFYNDTEMRNKGYRWDQSRYSAENNIAGFVSLPEAGTFYYDGSPDGGRHIGWLQLYEDGPWYYFDENGVMVTDREVIIDGEAWYFDSEGRMIEDQGTWIQSGGFWYFTDAYGNKAVGWKAILEDWYYFDESGRMVTGWVQSGDSLYYFSSGGAMVTGWYSLNGVWYFFGDSGEMVTGWLQDGNDWYYFTGSGKMATGWQKAGNDWYYFRDTGVMATGWVQSGNDWYYMKDSGAMATGWIKDGGKWYWFRPSGAMATGWQEIGGTWYYFTGSGAMKTGWLQLGNKWYWFDSSGAMATGWQEIGGSWEMFDNSGEWLYTWQGE